MDGVGFDLSWTIICCVTTVAFAVVIIVLVIGGHKITNLSLSREGGFFISTNDKKIWDEIAKEESRIDSASRKSIRKRTVKMKMLPLQGNSKDDIITNINFHINQPLVYAAYENHHVQELSFDGAEVYFSDKMHDICNVVQAWQVIYPELTYNVCEGYVNYWIKKIIIPITQRACEEKIAYYIKLIARYDVCKHIKKDLQRRIKENEKYLDDIRKLDECSQIISDAYVSTVMSVTEKEFDE